MAFDTAIQKVVKKIAQIPGLGVEVIIRQITVGKYDSSTGKARETKSDTTVKGVFEDVNQREAIGLVQSDDRKLTIPADSLTYTPTPKDRVVHSSIQYQIIRVKTVDQAGTSISYELFLRR